jgi:DNA gyrase/topoisomerase IV subunit A
METNVPAGELVRNAIVTYGTYVIEERAIPDSRDGLKPVHRRLLWSMSKLGLSPSGSYKKCARIVGDCMGLYHPHGDAGIYGALCSLVWQRYPLVEGHGNFGNEMGDPPAAMRYTEARLSQLGAYCFEHIDVLPMMENYSGEAFEPRMLDAILPYLLLNGMEGIAVALTSNVPPHNLQEIIHAVSHTVKHPDCTVDELLEFVHGPDYNCGGILVSTDAELKKVYTEGVGTLLYRCAYHFEPEEKQLVVTSFAPRFKPETFIAKCKKLSDDGILSYIADESSAENGIRLVVGFEDAEVLKENVIPLLYASVPYCFYVVDRDREVLKPELLDLKRLIQRWIDFRRNIEMMVLQKQLGELQLKLSREQVKLAVSGNVDALPAIFFSSKTREEMLQRFAAAPFNFTEEQAEYALELKLSQIAAWNKQDISSRMEVLAQEIQSVQLKLQDIDQVILEALNKLMYHADDRRTKINVAIPELPGSSIERYVSATHAGYIKMWQNSPTKGRGWDYDILIATGSMLTAILKSNKARQFYVSYLKEGQQDLTDVIALIPTNKKVIIATEPNGYGIAIAHPQKIDEYQLIKDCTELVFAIGLAETDKLVIAHDGLHRVFLGADVLQIGVSRRTSSPYRIMRSRKVDGLYSVPKDGALLDARGNDITEKGGEVAHVVGGTNFVILHDGARRTMNKDEVVNNLELIRKVFALC